MRCFNKLRFNPLAKLSVKFAGEDGIDNGGLSREFARLAVRAISKLQIFEGPPENRNLSLDASGTFRFTCIVMICI